MQGTYLHKLRSQAGYLFSKAELVDPFVVGPEIHNLRHTDALELVCEIDSKGPVSQVKLESLQRDYIFREFEINISQSKSRYQRTAAEVNERVPVKMLWHRHHRPPKVLRLLFARHLLFRP